MLAEVVGAAAVSGVNGARPLPVAPPIWTWLTLSGVEVVWGHNRHVVHVERAAGGSAVDGKGVGSRGHITAQRP